LRYDDPPPSSAAWAVGSAEARAGSFALSRPIMKMVGGPL